MEFVSASFNSTAAELRKWDVGRTDRTMGDITEGAFNPKVARSRLARPTSSEASTLPRPLVSPRVLGHLCGARRRRGRSGPHCRNLGGRTGRGAGRTPGRMSSAPATRRRLGLLGTPTLVIVVVAAVCGNRQPATGTGRLGRRY